MNLRHWIVDQLAPDRPAEIARLQATVKVMDDEYWHQLAPASPIQRQWHTIRDQLGKIDDAYRTNPLAARLVHLTSDFVIGTEATLNAPDWSQTFWDHPLNRIADRLHRWCGDR